MSDGYGCTCNARDSSECACDADWTPQELIDLRAENAELRAEVAKKTKMLQQGWIELCDTGIVAFKEENDRLRRLIKEVAIPSLALYARTDKAPNVAIQWLQEAVK